MSLTATDALHALLNQSGISIKSPTRKHHANRSPSPPPAGRRSVLTASPSLASQQADEPATGRTTESPFPLPTASWTRNLPSIVALHRSNKGTLSFTQLWTVLTHLDLSSQHVSSFDELPGLSDAPNLESLSLSNNELHSLPLSDQLPASLLSLTAVCNHISEFPDLSCIQLRHLGLSYNPLSDECGFEEALAAPSAEWLHSLDLGYCDLTQLDPLLSSLVNLPLLARLILHGNPLCLLEGYRPHVASTLVPLLTLDEHAIQDEEREDAPLLDTVMLCIDIQKIGALHPPPDDSVVRRVTIEYEWLGDLHRSESAPRSAEVSLSFTVHLNLPPSVELRDAFKNGLTMLLMEEAWEGVQPPTRGSDDEEAEIIVEKRKKTVKKDPKAQPKAEKKKKTATRQTTEATNAVDQPPPDTAALLPPRLLGKGRLPLHSLLTGQNSIAQDVPLWVPDETGDVHPQLLSEQGTTGLDMQLAQALRLGDLEPVGLAAVSVALHSPPPAPPSDDSSPRSPVDAATKGKGRLTRMPSGGGLIVKGKK